MNVDAVRGKLAERFTPEELDHLAGMYIDAYGSTELTADEVWEETICDALGFMNIFEGFAEEGDAAVFLVESWRAALETRSQTRAEQSQRSETGQKLSRERKYWRPKLSQSEWSLLNRRMEQEISGSENWLDEATKWTYASERGDSVFAVYGIGDGTEATPLYASSGKTAGTDYQAFMEAGKRFDYGTDRGTEALNRLFETLRRKQGKSDDGISATERRKSADGYDRASPVQGESNRRGSAGNGAQDSRGVKTSHELDSQGRRLTEAQRVFFKDSKVRDDEGQLLPVYHSTYAEDFTVFDRGRLGENTDGNATDESLAATSHVGFWFNTEDLSRNSRLGNRAENVYLNITSPFDAGNLDQLAARMDQFEGTPTERGKAFADWLRGDGYDGVVLRDEEFGGTSYVALEPQQIKRVTNQSPTLDSDIRFSRELSIDRLNEENDLLQQTIEGFQESGERPNTVSEQDAEKVARKIIREYSGTITADDISGDVRELSGMIERGDWDAAKAKAMEISQGTRSSLLLTKAIIFMAKAPIRQRLSMDARTMQRCLKIWVMMQRFS